jgi:protein SERAC1
LLAVRDLAKLGKSLSDGEMRQLAQSSSLRTTVGLARVKNVDLRFFLRPAPIPSNVKSNSIQNLFQQVLGAMPKSNDPGSKPIHDCIKFFTTTALENYVPGSDDETIQDIDIDLEFSRETHHIHTIPR